MKISMERFGKPYDQGGERRKKRNAIAGVVLFLMAVLIVSALLTVLIETMIRGYVVSGQEELWAASVASYWGGIIGGIISGMYHALMP